MGKISKAAAYIKTAYEYLSYNYNRKQLGMPKMARPRKLKEFVSKMFDVSVRSVSRIVMESENADTGGMCKYISSEY